MRAPKKAAGALLRGAELERTDRETTRRGHHGCVTVTSGDRNSADRAVELEVCADQMISGNRLEWRRIGKIDVLRNGLEDQATDRDRLCRLRLGRK